MQSVVEDSSSRQVMWQHGPSVTLQQQEETMRNLSSKWPVQPKIYGHLEWTAIVDFHIEQIVALAKLVMQFKMQLR